MKKEYAKFINETTLDYRIPTSLDYEGSHYIGDLTRYPNVLSALNFFPIENADQEVPVPEPGYHLEERYALSSNIIIRSYITVEDPPVYRNLSLSKRKLMLNFKGLGIWEQVKQFMQTTNDYWDNWEASTTLDEQEEMMQAAIAALKTAFSLSEEDVENIITSSVAE